MLAAPMHYSSEGVPCMFHACSMHAHMRRIYGCWQAAPNHYSEHNYFGTRCCCAPELCTVAAADVTALDIQFCYVPLDLCMTTPWPLWCFYGGILLAMVAMVLLVNSVSFHRVVSITVLPNTMTRINAEPIR